MIGADPELFLERGGQIVSAEGMIGGTKEAPFPISTLGHAIQEDNVMVEFNIPASEAREEFVDNINFVKEYLTTLASTRRCTLNTLASAELDPRYLNTLQAMEFGCQPDFNVYTRRTNPRPSPSGNLRTCGGHIHVGYFNPEDEISALIIKAMDITLGLPSLELDKDDRRREMYGKAGAFRFKPYGVEYRTLSNFWIFSDELTAWAFEQTQKAIEMVNNGTIQNIDKKYFANVRLAINENNKNLAKELISEKLEKKIKKVA